MAATNRTPAQVIRDVDREWFPDEQRYLRAIEDALVDEGWMRTHTERLAAIYPPRSYSLAEIRDGTGFPPTARFVVVPLVAG